MQLEDIESDHALRTMTDYKAGNPANSREAAYKVLREAEQNAVATQIAAAGMDALIAARRSMHGVILGVKNEAKAFYGPSSDQIAVLGLKKKSERSRSSGRGKKGTEGIYLPPAVEAGERLVVGRSGRWPIAANQAAKCWLPAGGDKSTPNVSFSTWRTHTSDPMLPLSFEESCRSTPELTRGYAVAQRKRRRRVERIHC